MAISADRCVRPELLPLPTYVLKSASCLQSQASGGNAAILDIE
jgi:hypothetical protein